MFKDKNILYIVHNYTSFQKDQIEEASRHFNKVYVLVRYKLVTVIANFLKLKVLQKYREENCIDLHDLPDNVEVFKTPVNYIPYGPIYKLVGNFHYKAVKNVIEKNNLIFDIVHSHFLWSAGYAGMKVSEEYKVPFVVTGHGYDVYSLPFKNEWWKNTLKLVAQKANGLISISQSNVTKLRELAGDREINLIPNGFSPKLFFPMQRETARGDLGIDRQAKVLVIVGNIITIKGHRYLIDAMKSLSEKYQDLVLYIVGSGNLQLSLEKEVKSLKLSKKIFFVGQRPHDEIAKWINASDFLVISSLQEGAPVVLLESLSCGVPVIGTRVGMVEEVLKSDKYGLVCDIKDSHGLADVIDKGFSKSWNQREIAEYGKQFTWAKANEKILQIYSKLLLEEKER